ncbi:uncharacterized protein LY89DRAFT_139653 [Mollisia scopiformis]|uniref:Uncharacterized protein n=1 Tax=Mollisia scopiformis TaxID=149040 RepID=A0A194X3P2_MOLSC|nr:uncharacterized protein LY89DRAFT_139653 [Mollisia scopiformis]KUJ14437.1 hypothetical protein LY89DRAFT_139653 [Mollisia scopiformis]
MVKSGTSSKSVWAQFGLGGRSRDADVPSAPVRVSEDAQAKSFDKKAPILVEFTGQNRDRLPDRPSTSAGPASSFARRKNAEKRETKDDLHFNPLAVHGRGTTFYNFPLPGSLLTPASSPKSSAPSVHKSSLARPSTPESMEITPAPPLASATTMNVPQGEIGMALGSPSHAPTPWQEHSVETYIRHESPDQMDSSVDGSWDNPPLKHKPSRWKILGGIFGAGKKPQPAFYQLQPETTQQSESDHVQEPVDKRPKSRGRGWSNSTRRRNNKPEISRSNTLPAFDMSGGRAATATPEITLEGGPLIENASRFAQKGAGLLDVDIPSIQMERYSIMFSGVLQKPQQTSSSLLARRQATLDKLKTVNEALASKEQEIEVKTRLLLPRRATSPSAMKTQSPAFSLFPNTPSRTRELSPSSRHRPSGSLHRSNTSPAALSPSRPSFAPGPDNEAHARLMAKEHGRTSPEKRRDAQESRTNKLKTEAGRPSTASPTPKPSQWSPDKSHLTLDDNSDNEEGDEEVVEECEKEDTYDPAPFPMKPKLVEPDWQIINPPHAHATAPSVSGSSTSGSNHSTSASNSSSISTPPSTGLPAKPNMPSPPLTSSISPKAQAQARARAATVSTRPPQTRSRSATTTTIPRRSPQPNPETIDSPTLHPEPIRSLSSAISPSSAQAQSRPSPSKTTPVDEDDDAEARLKSLADVSIARQISVSRQQRQLLVPIKTSLKSSSSNGSLKRSPNPVNAASPLSVVAGGGAEVNKDEKKGEEISIGLRVGGGGGEREMRQRELRDLQNRKSERVVVERVSVVSTS